MQENGKAQKMSDTYGPTSEMPLACYDLPSQSWRTCEDTSLWDLPMSLATLPAWGMTQGGVLYELQMPEHRTIAHEFSSLPTPKAGDGERGRDLGRLRQDLKSRELATVLTHLPTPTARDYKDHQIEVAKHRPNDTDTLNRAIAHLLLTPAVNDMGAGKDPQAWDEWAAKQKAADGRPAPHGKSLEQEALKMLPTPLAEMGNLQREDFTPNLRTVIEGNAMLSGALTPPPLTAGSTSSDELHQPPLFAAMIGTA